MTKTLLLVDGSGYLYRAFHAMPDLRTATGEPTGALRGYIGMLRTLCAEVPYDYCACIFDAKGPTFRDALFDQYKAHRPSMPADLAAQIPPIHQAVRALGWPVIEIEGVEADDVIGTLARRASAIGLRTVVATGDKDLAQLVDDQVSLIDTMSRDGGPPRRYDAAAVLAKFGVAPANIVDYLSLVGDSVDNVPGVDKVGPKTAVKWLQLYGNLDGVIANADRIEGKVGENLRKALPWLPTARVLVTVKTDCNLLPHVETIDALAARPSDKDALRAIFERYEFRSWLRDLGLEAATGSPRNDGGSALPDDGGLIPIAAAPRHDAVRFNAADDAGSLQSLPRRPDVPRNGSYETVLTEAQLVRWLAIINAAPLTAFDTETTSLDPMRAQLVGFSLAVDEWQGCYVPLAHHAPGAPDQLPLTETLARIKPWLEDAGCAKVGQNLKYDAHVLANYGIELRGVAHDTLLQSYVLEAHRSHDLGALALRHLNRTTVPYEAVCGKGVNQLCFDQVEVERATAYAAEDAEVTLGVHHWLWPHIVAEKKLAHVYQTIELPVSRVLFAMERHGVLIDQAKLSAQSTELAHRIASLEQRAAELAGQPFNLGSPKQVGEILFGKLGLPVIKRTASKAPSTDEEVLEKLAQDYPLPKLLLEHRSLSKLKSTYCDKLPASIFPATGRVHTSYGQAIAVTGRLSSSEPNLQNIPIRTAEGRRIREAFIAPAGWHVMSADYSQIELRIMAHISNDAGLLRAFAAGDDVHRVTAAEVFGVAVAEVSQDQRRTAKTINFGLIYGMSAFGLAANLGIERDAAKLYIDRYFTRYPGVAEYMELTRSAARRQGYVETVFGRRLWLPEINSPNGPRRAAAERAAINAPMQGTAADLIKLSMIAVSDWLVREKLNTALVMQVHDELVFEVPPDELAHVRATAPKLMREVASLQVPLLAEVGVGANWDEAH